MKDVLVIDCYDSFTYNLCQQVGKTGCNVHVFRSDTDPDVVFSKDYERVILSPGPGRPEDSGLCLDAISRLGIGEEVPVLGVCLGHQAICTYFGAKVVQTGRPVHGTASEIIHDSGNIYRGVESPLMAARYHSLAVSEESLPEELMLTAKTAGRTVMGVRHTQYPIEGVQFHPESFLTGNGDRIIKNFILRGIR